MLDKRTDVCYYKHVNKIGKENKMRHIYVKTPNGLGKLNFYDGSLWHSTVNGLTYEMKYKDKDLIWTKDPKNLKELIISRRFSK